MTRVKNVFCMCRMLLISSLCRTSEPLGWPSTSHQLFSDRIRLWLRNKASIRLPKWTFFCGLHLLKWKCAIRHVLILCYMVPAHNILYKILLVYFTVNFKQLQVQHYITSPCTNHKLNVFFPHLLSINNKKSNLPLINIPSLLIFPCVARRNKKFWFIHLVTPLQRVI